MPASMSKLLGWQDKWPLCVAGASFPPWQGKTQRRGAEEGGSVSLGGGVPSPSPLPSGCMALPLVGQLPHVSFGGHVQKLLC